MVPSTQISQNTNILVPLTSSYLVYIQGLFQLYLYCILLSVLSLFPLLILHLPTVLSIARHSYKKIMFSLKDFIFNLPQQQATPRWKNTKTFCLDAGKTIFLTMKPFQKQKTKRNSRKTRYKICNWLFLLHYFFLSHLSYRNTNNLVL